MLADLYSACRQFLKSPGVAVAAMLLVAGSRSLRGAVTAADSPPASSYRFERVGAGIYCAIGTGAMPVGCNSGIIVTPEGVIVVDSGGSPAAARALLAELGAITPLPVRYLINTHFHYDHTFGNEAFPSTVTVIGHEFTRTVLADDPLREPSFLGFLSGLQVQSRQLTAQIATETAAGKRRDLQSRLDVVERDRRAALAVTLRVPALAFRDRLSLTLGGREIQLIALGRGHTAGDLVVLLPKERVICTGDLYNGYVGYMGDAFVDEWAGTLDRLAGLDFATVVPGHGSPFSDRTKLALVRECFRDLWRQASDLEAKGTSAGATARQIDLRRHAEHFPQFRTVGVPPVAVTRIFEVIAQRRSDHHAPIADNPALPGPSADRPAANKN